MGSHYRAVPGFGAVQRELCHTVGLDDAANWNRHGQRYVSPTHRWRYTTADPNFPCRKTLGRDSRSRTIDLYNSGQICGAGTRLYAHKDVFDVVLEGIAAEAKKLRVGHGLDERTQMGPLISARQMDRVMGYIDDGSKAGARVVAGGGRVGEQGYFVEPTILADTTAEMSVVREEIFGPVLCAMSFDGDLDSVAHRANDSIYGLAASIWTRDLGIAHKMVRRIKAGSIGVNTAGSIDPAVPFGGYKQSGWGREKGREVLELYTEIKSVVIAL